MRVAFAGAHRTGKTTLIEAVSARLPAYVVVDEPYRVLEEEGHELSDPPTADDFALQLRCSIASLAEPRPHALFDRCPLDFVAYLQAIDEPPERADWLAEVRAAMESLDLVVVVPIEEPDRIPVPAHEDRRLRRRVDDAIRTLLLDDPHALEVATLEVSGSLAERVRQVMRAIAAG